MSFADTVWIVAPLIPVLAGLLFFMKKRQKTVDYAEGQAFKVALPWWVSTIERLVVAALLTLFAVIASKIYFSVSADSPSPAPISSPGPVYVILGGVAIILPLTLLCANVVSWIVPPLRSANQRAFRSNGLSFKTMNVGLIRAALVSGLFGLALIGIAAIKPWSS